MMGGAEAITNRARTLYDQGQYRLAMEILNKLIYAEPQNQQGKDLLASVFEQLGYQYESASMRNVFLSSAQELRDGAAPVGGRRSISPSQARAMTTTQWWDALGTRVDSSQADGMEFTINLITPDTGQNFVIEMSGATLSNIEGFLSDDADVTVTMNRSDLELVIMGRASLTSQLQAGVGSAVGNQEVLLQLDSVLVEFDPGFEIMPGTVNP